MDISLQSSMLLWIPIWISLDFYGYPISMHWLAIGSRSRDVLSTSTSKETCSSYLKNIYEPRWPWPWTSLLLHLCGSQPRRRRYPTSTCVLYYGEAVAWLAANGRQCWHHSVRMTTAHNETGRFCFQVVRTKTNYLLVLFCGELTFNHVAGFTRHSQSKSKESESYLKGGGGITPWFRHINWHLVKKKCKFKRGIFHVLRNNYRMSNWASVD